MVHSQQITEPNLIFLTFKDSIWPIIGYLSLIVQKMQEKHVSFECMTTNGSKLKLSTFQVSGFRMF